MPVDVTGTLRKALSELQSERQRIDRQITAIHTVLGGAVHGRVSMSIGRRRRRRRMSAAARRAVSQRMKAYWAARKAGRGGKRGRATKKAG